MANYRFEFNQALWSRQANPEAAINDMMKARDKAKLADDDKFVLYANHWILQTMLFNTRNFEAALPLAMETAVEARKEKYQDMQEHICVYQDLMVAYFGIDPHGNAEKIAEAIDYMGGEITSDFQCRACLQDLRCSYEIVSGRMDKAVAACEEYISMAENMGWHRRHHQTIAYYHLCNIAFINKDWPTLLAYAKVGIDEGEPSSGLVAHNIFFLASSALAHRHMGDDVKAREFYYRAVSEAKATGAVMNHEYFDVMCAYHEFADEYADALKVIEHELTYLETGGQHYAEADARVRQCKLLHKLEKPFENERKAAEAVINKLKNPQPLRDELEALSEKS